MDEAQRNSEIEKIANEMVHDGVSPDEQDAEKLSKYKDQVKSDCNLDDEQAMERHLGVPAEAGAVRAPRSGDSKGPFESRFPL